MIPPHIAILLLPLLLPLTTAYSIDQVSCSSIQSTPELTPNDINNAVQEALNIAKYAVFRMAPSSGSTPGEIIESLIGKNNRQTFINRMNLLSLIDERSIVDNGVNIVCGTRYIQQNPNDLSFIDSRFPNMRPILASPDHDNTDNCIDNEVAFGFPIESTDPNQPSWITVLCDTETGALADKVTMNSVAWNADWSDIAASREVTTVEVSAEFISAHLLHELLHFVDRTLTETLSNGDAEVYRLTDIQALPEDVKASNTESYLLIATALYVIPYALQDDASFARLPPLSRPLLGPHFLPVPSSP